MGYLSASSEVSKGMLAAEKMPIGLISFFYALGLTSIITLHNADILSDLFIVAQSSMMYN